MGLGQFGEHAGLALLAQPVALTADVNRRREVQEPVQDGSSQDLIGEDIAPDALGNLANQDKVAEYRSGKDKLFGFFVGQTMKAMAGKGNPALINEALKKALA